MTLVQKCCNPELKKKLGGGGGHMCAEKGMGHYQIYQIQTP